MIDVAEHFRRVSRLLLIGTDSISTRAASHANGFWGWLFSDAGAGWMVALIAVVGLIVAFIDRHRPLRIVVRELRRSSLVNVSPDVRSRIKVSFDDGPVANLGQLDCVITNEGREVIRDANIVIAFPPSTSVLQASRVPDQADVALSVTLNQQGEAAVHIPYLNPQREHKHAMRLSLIVDGEHQNIRVRGSGEGWSVRHIKLHDSLRNARDNFFARMLGLFSIGIILFFLSLVRPVVFRPKDLIVFGVGLIAWSYVAVRSGIVYMRERRKEET